MNIQPGFEARLAALERRQLYSDARLEELAAEIREGFQQLGRYFDKHMAANKEEIAGIKATMATKDDLAAMETRNQIVLDAMETRILNAFKQLLTIKEEG